MNHSMSIPFVVKSAVAVISMVKENEWTEGISGPSERLINFKIKIAPDFDLLTKEGASLKDVECSLTVKSGDYYNEHTDANKAIGVFVYRKHEDEYSSDEENIFASVVIDDSFFSELFSLVLSGRSPQKIMIYARDLEYGRDFEGQDAVLDTSRKNRINLVDIVTFEMASVVENLKFIEGESASFESKILDLMRSFKSLIHKELALYRFAFVIIIGLLLLK